MEVEIRGSPDQGLLSQTEESQLEAKKLLTSPIPNNTPTLSPELFTLQVPCNLTSPNNTEDEQEMEMEVIRTPEQSVSLVPTLERDQDDLEADDLDISGLKSPETPEIDISVCEDSMGFDNLQALSIVTPGIDSTQSFMSLINKNISPIKRKCFRADFEPVNSTQTYFDITKHYKLLSVERKKVLYGESAGEDSTVKPLRRKLFKDDEPIVVKPVVEGDKDQLECFEEAWEKVTVLKPDHLEKVGSSRETSSEHLLASANKETDVMSDSKSNCMSDLPFNAADSFQTPAQQIQKINEVEIVPAMVVEETVSSTVEEVICPVVKEVSPVPEAMTTEEVKVSLVEQIVCSKTDITSTDCVPAMTVEVACQEVVSEEEVCKAELAVTEDVIMTETASSKLSVTEFNSSGLRKQVQESSESSVNEIVSEQRESARVIVTLGREQRQEAAANDLKTSLESQQGSEKRFSVPDSIPESATTKIQLGCKRALTSRQPLNLQNRVYKTPRLDSANEDRVSVQNTNTDDNGRPLNCPELVQELFRETGAPAAGFPSYPPAISRIVPIPIPDKPIRKRSGLFRRPSASVSLHPYIARNILVNEE